MRATLPLRSTAIATQGALAIHSVFITDVLPVLSNPELVTLLLEPPEAMRFLSLPTRPVAQSPLFPLQLNPATAKSPTPAVVRVTLGAVPVLVALALDPTPTTPR